MYKKIYTKQHIHSSMEKLFFPFLSDVVDIIIFVFFFKF